MLSNIFDSHSHYDDIQFDEDRDEVIARLFANGVSNICAIGADLPSSERAAALAKKYDKFYCAVGVHPEEVDKLPDNYLEILENLVKDNPKKVKAIGEIGLDYHYEEFSKERQAQVFDEQMKLAEKLDLPVVIHNRDAHEDTLNMLKKHSSVKGVVHCFSGSAEMAKELVKMGWYIGFTGVVTFKNARRAVEAAAAVPLDRILIETDCPYLAPVPYRGKRNDSSLLTYVAEKLAEIKGISAQEICDITAENAKRIYRITD